MELTGAMAVNQMGVTFVIVKHKGYFCFDCTVRRVTMTHWMIISVSGWMSIREITERWRLDTVNNILNRFTLWCVRNAVRFTV